MCLVNYSRRAIGELWKVGLKVCREKAIIKGCIWPKVRFLCIDGERIFDGAQNGVMWGDLAIGGKNMVYC